jgi:hypothetical protein
MVQGERPEFGNAFATFADLAGDAQKGFDKGVTV